MVVIMWLPVRNGVKTSVCTGMDWSFLSCNVKLELRRAMEECVVQFMTVSEPCLQSFLSHYADRDIRSHVRSDSQLVVVLTAVVFHVARAIILRSSPFHIAFRAAVLLV